MWRQTLTSVALITVSANGRDNVMACEWAMMVSHAPMCFTISVHPRNATHDLLVTAGEFGPSPLIFHGGRYFQVGQQVPKA